jgi:ribonuclease-3
VLADLTEAVLGALYLDGGLAPARALIVRFWGDAIDRAVKPPKDPKTELQEWAQGRGLPLPLYEVVATEGPAHQPNFRVRVTLAGGDCAEETGASKRIAEAGAASLLLARVRELPS